jgi:diaminopimelate decarboxylase
VGLHLHIGSQITKPSPFQTALRKVQRLLDEVGREGVHLEYLNIGGGLGIVYDKERPQSADAFARKVGPLLKRTGLKIILEPGRFIVGNAGILVTKVLYLKESGRKHFVIVDAAMNDLLRPSLYDAYHKILPVENGRKSLSPAAQKADVVGPICESGDFLGKDRKLKVQADEYLAVFGSGAYGFSMSSNYNSRPRACEVLVHGKRVWIIRERETYMDVVDKERLVRL